MNLKKMKNRLHKNFLYIILSILSFVGMIVFEDYFIIFLIILVILPYLFNIYGKNYITNSVKTDDLNSDIVIEKYEYDFLVDKLEKNNKKLLYLLYNDYKIHIFTPYDQKKTIYIYIYGKNLNNFLFNELEEKLNNEVEVYKNTIVKNFIFHLEEKDKKINEYLLYYNKCVGGRGWSDVRQIIAIVNSERKSYYGPLYETDDEARYLLNKLKIIEMFKN